MSRAILIGKEPPCPLGYQYVTENYDAVVIGSLQLGELLQFHNELVLQALAEGKPVVLYTPGLADAPKNRGLAASIASAKRELKNWGIVFTDGAHKRLVTAQEARMLLSQGRQPAPGAVLTPLAKEVLEGTK